MSGGSGGVSGGASNGVSNSGGVGGGVSEAMPPGGEGPVSQPSTSMLRLSNIVFSPKVVAKLVVAHAIRMHE